MRLHGRWVDRAAPVAGRAVLRILKATCRFSYLDWEAIDALRSTREPVIYAFWHSRLLLMPFAARRDRETVLLVSSSRDGDLLRRVMAPFGGRNAIRGSSTRGGHAALRDMARAIEGGCDAVVTPDGPRGPARRSKVGIIALARMTGAPIIPVAYGADRAKRFRSWDRFLVPIPFAKVRYAAGRPIAVPGDASDLEAWRARLDAELDRVTDRADGIA